jgi:ABC-2 type transport system permease protein
MLWTLLNPLLMMTVMTVVFSSFFKQDIPHFPIYFLAGSILFNFNSESTNQAMVSITGNAALLKKVYIPKYLFPVSKVIFNLINLAFSFVALILVMIVLRIPFRVTMFLSVVPIFYQMVFTMGLCLILSCATVFFRDIVHLYGIFTLAWMYLTPLFYPVSILPEAMRGIIRAVNPLFLYIDYLRGLILGGVMPGLADNLLCLAWSFVSLAAGLIIFYKKQDRFILYI